MTEKKGNVNSKRQDGQLGLASLLAIGIGTTIGAGVVTVTGQAVGVTGRSAWLAYLIAIIWGAFNCLPAFFMASAIKVRGGGYSVVAGMMGPRIGGIYSCVSIAMALNFATFCVGFAQYIKSLYPGANSKAVALLILLVFYLLNLTGLDLFARVQSILTVFLLLALVAFGISGLPKVSPEVFAVSDTGFLMNGFDGLIQAVTMFVFSTIAYGILINFSGNTRDSKKNVPKAMALTVLVLCLVYPLVAVVAGGVLPVSEAANQPLTVVAAAIWPKPLVVLFVIAGPLAALVTTLNGNFANYGINLIGAAKDGWFPDFMAKTNRFGAPYAFLTLGCIIALVPILLDYNISAIIRNMVIVFNVNSFFNFLSAVNMPRKYPEKWEGSSLHIPNSIFYVLMVFSGICVLASTYLQIRNLEPFVILFTFGLYAAIIIYGTIRYKKGYVHFNREINIE